MVGLATSQATVLPYNIIYLQYTRDIIHITYMTDMYIPHSWLHPSFIQAHSYQANAMNKISMYFYFKDDCPAVRPVAT